MNLPPLSPIGEKVLAAATQESAGQGQHYLGVEHLFLALAEERRADLRAALAGQKIDLINFLEMLRVRISTAESQFQGDDIGPTPRCREILKLASRIAARTDRGIVEPAHLLSAILREGRSVPVRLLRAVGTDVAELEEALRSEPKKVVTPTPLLDKFGRDMTHLATRGRLSPIIGRERETDLVAQVLLRKNKNNPVLLGAAGVGKTAVVEGFAQRLVDPSCPEPLRNRRIIELSVGSLVAGTKYRGEFEERILGIATEVAENPEIILFLDELHTLVGAGASDRDSLDASNILKPALARGELRCIGASTLAEYRRHIEPDPALERRFERILVDEPTPAEAVAILEHLRPYLESHHEVEISPQALKTAVDLTARHVLDRQLPDKALDALDQSCARKRLRRYTGGSEPTPGRPAPGRPAAGRPAPGRPAPERRVDRGPGKGRRQHRRPVDRHPAREDLRRSRPQPPQPRRRAQGPGLRSGPGGARRDAHRAHRQGRPGGARAPSRSVFLHRTGPASARPTWRTAWPRFSSATPSAWCASTCPSTWRRTRYRT